MTTAAPIPRCSSCGAEQAPAALDGGRCPECGRLLRLAALPVVRGPEGWCKRHPDEALTGVCASCGRFTCTVCDVSVGGIRYCDDCRTRQRAAFTMPGAWDERGTLGRWRAWYRTTSLVTGQPSRFFDRLEPRGRLGGALLFATLGAMLLQSGHAALKLAGLVFGLGTTLLDAVLLTGASYSPAMFLNLGLRLVTLLASPFLILGLFLVVAVLQHVALRVVDAGAEHGIEATIKVACYAFALGWLGVIPYLGHLAFPVWWTVVMVIGTARIHRRSTTRTSIVILPTFLLLVAPVAACASTFLLGLIAL